VSAMYGTGAKGKATRLHALIVRSRGQCERCGGYSNLQCAHIVGRSFSWTRTDENNAWCLCGTCHAHLTAEPFEHVQFAMKTHGEDGYELLRLKARDGVNRKFDWDAEVVRLKALAESLGVAA
jgi:hypothetical protein